MKKIKKAFTLIEIIVSLTIFLMVMISIFSVYSVSNEISAKSDVNRAMQENIKNVITEI
jgi:prepilin-type N-terminal cleavage/methylation domain-containing protein